MHIETLALIGGGELPYRARQDFHFPSFLIIITICLRIPLQRPSSHLLYLISQSYRATWPTCSTRSRARIWALHRSTTENLCSLRGARTHLTLNLVRILPPDLHVRIQPFGSDNERDAAGGRGWRREKELASVLPSCIRPSPGKRVIILYHNNCPDSNKELIALIEKKNE